MKLFKIYWYDQDETKLIDFIKADNKEEAEGKARSKYFGKTAPAPLISVEEVTK